MKAALFAALIAALLSVPAQAAARHKWFEVDYATGKCALAPSSPLEFYNGGLIDTWGWTLDRITPDDVTKGANGVIHVHMTGTHNGTGMKWDFFTANAACEQFVHDNGIKPQGADKNDIN